MFVDHVLSADPLWKALVSKPVYSSPSDKYEEFVNVFMMCHANVLLFEVNHHADDVWES